MAHSLGRTDTHAPVTMWLEVIAKAAALGIITDDDPAHAADRHSETP